MVAAAALVALTDFFSFLPPALVGVALGVGLTILGLAAGSSSEAKKSTSDSSELALLVPFLLDWSDFREDKVDVIIKENTNSNPN